MTTKSRPTLAADPVVSALRDHGLKLTPQRLAIAHALAATHGHPNVQEIHGAVADAFPTMSLATVYNTLRVLAAAGVVSELPFSGGVRYDADPTPHVNLVCSDCGRILDAHEYDGVLKQLASRVRSRRDFRVEGHRFDFYGRCAACRRQARPPARAGTASLRRESARSR